MNSHSNSVESALGLFSVNRQSNTLFRFEKCSYTVTIKGKENILLNNVSGSVRSGHVLAIMGPSGAGKTCLIDLLTLEAREGRSVGKVSINNELITKKSFAKTCATVPQIDRHWSFLTCRETIGFAADLLLALSDDEKKKRVDLLLTTMGLNVCADTKVGNAFFPGLSGGQKRRLSIALALLSNPLVLFLDEPTSGLDAAAASSIMNFIKKLAQSANICVVCTIHQPSSAVYTGFDKVMLLSSGRVAFNGDAMLAEKYFEKIGYFLPKHTNVAEFMLDLVNREFTDPQKVDDVLNKYVFIDECENEIHSPVSLQTKHTSFISQVLTLVRRQGILYFRDPTIYTGRLLVFFATCIFFAIVYIKSKDRNQSQIVPRMWLIQWMLCVPCMFGVVAVYGYSEEAAAIKREVKNGMLHPTAYLTANFILQVPSMFLLGVAALSVAGYGIGQWQSEQYFLMLTVWAVSLWCYESTAQVLSVVTSQPLLGMLLFLVIWFSSFLFNGILIDVDDVPWPFKILTYIFPYKYSLRSMTAIEFLGTSFEGAIETPLSPVGFICNVGANACFGATGKQVLTSLGTVFRSISPDVNITNDLGILFAIGSVMKILYLLLFIRHTSAAKKVILPTELRIMSATTIKVVPQDDVLSLENV
jgi:ABC-type multidrug transport system ATPase subunit